MAWLMATPEKQKQSRYKQLVGEDEHHPSLELPPVDFGAYLVEYLQELGFCSYQGMGATPISFLEIQAWQQATGLVLSPWEVLAIHTLSSDYVGQLRTSENPQTPAPFNGGDLEKKRESVFSFFKDLARRDKND